MNNIFSIQNREVSGLENVYVRAITYGEMVIVAKLKEDQAAERLVELSVVDENGARMLNDGEAKNLPAAMFHKLAMAAQDLNDLGDEAVEDAKKN